MREYFLLKTQFYYQCYPAKNIFLILLQSPFPYQLLIHSKKKQHRLYRCCRAHPFTEPALNP